jgi:hypothetical protein
MRSPSRHVLILAAIFAVGGALYGLETRRWSSVEDVVDPARFDAIGPVIGRWRGDDPTTKWNDKEKTFLYARRYVRPDGRALTASVVSGPSGFVAAHTPDVCYPGSGHRMQGEPVKSELAAPFGSVTAWCGDFHKQTETASSRLKVFWTMTADGSWEAPSYARVYFARARTLTKCYVIVPYAEGDPGAADEVYRDFAPAFLAEVNARLFAPPNGPAAKPG